jgi:hypothetical protein
MLALADLVAQIASTKHHQSLRFDDAKVKKASRCWHTSITASFSLSSLRFSELIVPIAALQLCFRSEWMQQQMKTQSSWTRVQPAGVKPSGELCPTVSVSKKRSTAPVNSCMRRFQLNTVTVRDVLAAV